MNPEYQAWYELSASQLVRDVDLQLYEFIIRAPTFRYIGQSQDMAIQHKHEWLEFHRQEITTTVASSISSYSANGTGITIVVADGSIFLVGDQINIDENDSTFIITGISTNTLTVSEIRGVAGSGSNGKTVHYTRGFVEGSTYGTSTGVEIPTQEYNYTQIFRRDIEITDSMIATTLAGGVYGLNNAFEQALNQKLQDLAWDMNQAAMNGIRQLRSGSTVKGYMGGIRQFIDQAGGNVVTASGALTLTLLNQLAREIYDDMSATGNLMLIVPPSQAELMATFTNNQNASSVVVQGQIGQVNGTFGNNMRMFVPKVSGLPPMPVIVDQNMPPTQVWMIDPDYIHWTPLTGRTMQVIRERIPGKDGESAWIRGEYTLTVRDGKYRHGLIKSLTA